MSIPILENFGELKELLTTGYIFTSRFEALYPRATQNFEKIANRRLRTRKQEKFLNLTTSSVQAVPGTSPPLEKGYAAVPYDYLAWRAAQWRGREPLVDLDYVHPAYLRSTWVDTDHGEPKVFSIENGTFYASPPDDRVAMFVFHYYTQIPTITGSALDNNWLLLDHPDLYLEGTLFEVFLMMRNAEAAVAHKQLRDEKFAEVIQLSALTTGATSSKVRGEASEYF